jgi:hypothetical protein
LRVFARSFWLASSPAVLPPLVANACGVPPTGRAAASTAMTANPAETGGSAVT